MTPAHSPVLPLSDPHADDPVVVAKAAGAIQMATEQTALQRKTWTVLLIHAYEELMDDNVDWHSIPIQTLAYHIGFNSKNTKHLKDVLRSLQSVTAEMNFLGFDKKAAWDSVQVIGRVRVEAGTVYYRYDRDLRRDLANSEFFATIDIRTLRKLRSSYGLALYENVALFRQQGVTPVWSIENWRGLLGAREAGFDRTSRFIERVMRKAIDDVNTHSDVEVSANYAREHRRVTGMSVSVVAKDGRLPAPVRQASAPVPAATPLPAPIVATQLPDIVLRINRAVGMDTLAAIKHLDQHGEDKLERVLAYVVARMQRGTLDKPAAYFVHCLRLPDDGLVVKTVPAPPTAPSRTPPAVEAPAPPAAAPERTLLSRRLDRAKEVWQSMETSQQVQLGDQFLGWWSVTNPTNYRLFVSSAKPVEASPMARVALYEYLLSEGHVPELEPAAEPAATTAPQP